MKMMQDVQLSYIPDSHGWIKVYLKAKDAETAEAWFNSFWNHNATSQDKPEWIFDNELAFGSTWDRFKRALDDIYLFILLNDDEDAFKGEEGGAMPLAKELAKAKIAEMSKKDSSMRYGRVGHVYTLGEIATNDEKAFTTGRHAGE